MRAQHQTTMTVHVRKLNRGMSNQQSTINKQAKQQKPVPGAEFQKEFKKFKFISALETFLWTRGSRETKTNGVKSR